MAVIFKIQTLLRYYIGMATGITLRLIQLFLNSIWRPKIGLAKMLHQIS